ncbi:MAG: FliA/WhiG family RNA polymerase sigma factor [Thermodesulfovibrionales bacterium]
MPEYTQSIKEEEQERVIREFLPYIKYTANRLAWRLPPQLTVDDLVSCGLMGLLEALGKFEPGRVKLKTFAEFRIKGAMLDELRATDWVPRSMKKKIHDIWTAHSRLEKELGRAPDDEEIAALLEISLDEYYKILHDGSGAISLRFEDFDGDDGSEGMNILECIPDRNAKTPLAILETEDQKRIIAGHISELPEKEQLLLSLYYWEELTMKEIGRIMNLTEGRVCQIHAQALIRLKAKISGDGVVKERQMAVR